MNVVLKTISRTNAPKLREPEKVQEPPLQSSGDKSKDSAGAVTRQDPSLEDLQAHFREQFQVRGTRADLLSLMRSLLDEDEPLRSALRALGHRKMPVMFQYARDARKEDNIHASLGQKRRRVKHDHCCHANSHHHLVLL